MTTVVPRRSRRRVPTALVAMLLATVATVATVVVAGDAGADSGAVVGVRAEEPSPRPARIVGRTPITERTVRLRVATDSFARPVPVEVTLPTRYRAEPQRRWPVTYYLGGTNHDETTFRSYAGESATRDFDSLVVSPRGDSGFWSDWYNAGALGVPRYETFVIDELIPLIDATFRTSGLRSQRAIMGESMGGFGVMKLAARHPEKFVAAASLSGGLDSNFAQGIAIISAAPALQGAAPNSIFGDRLTQEIRWRGNNPRDLARNLRGIDLQLFTGNGIYDPAYGEDPVAEGTGGCALEGGVIRPTSLSMHRTLNRLGIAHRWVDLPWGCHSIALFNYEIGLAATRFERVFGAPPTAPAVFDHRSIEPHFSAWGWQVAADRRRALEWLTLTDAGRRGVRLAGSGTTRVRTAPYFAPGQRVRLVTLGQSGSSSVLRADPAGRLSFIVVLGAPNTQQQDTVGALTRVHRVALAFRALRFARPAAHSTERSPR